MTLFVATESTGAVPALNTVNQPFGNAVCQSGERIHVGNAGSAFKGEQQ